MNVFTCWLNTKFAQSTIVSFFSGKPNETFEFGNSVESCNSDKFCKCGYFEKKVWNLVLFEEKNGQFGNPIKYSAYENFGVLC